MSKNSITSIIAWTLSIIITSCGGVDRTRPPPPSRICPEGLQLIELPANFTSCVTQDFSDYISCVRGCSITSTDISQYIDSTLKQNFGLQFKSITVGEAVEIQNKTVGLINTHIEENSLAIQQAIADSIRQCSTKLEPKSSHQKQKDSEFSFQVNAKPQLPERCHSGKIPWYCPENWWTSGPRVIQNHIYLLNATGCWNIDGSTTGKCLGPSGDVYTSAGETTLDRYQLNSNVPCKLLFRQFKIGALIARISESGKPFLAASTSRSPIKIVPENDGELQFIVNDCPASPERDCQFTESAGEIIPTPPNSTFEFIAHLKCSGYYDNTGSILVNLKEISE